MKKRCFAGLLAMALLVYSIAADSAMLTASAAVVSEEEILEEEVPEEEVLEEETSEEKISEEEVSENVEENVNAESSDTETEIQLPVGLPEAEWVDLEEFQEDRVFDEGDMENPFGYFSEVYENEWDKYSTNYYYNQLDDEKQRIWDAMDAMCLNYLMGSRNADTYEGKYMTEFVGCGTMTGDESYSFARIFRFSNPQYYFLNTTVWKMKKNTGDYYAAFGIYPSFADGTVRQEETYMVAERAEELLAQSNLGGSEAENVLNIHDTVVNNVEYNYDAAAGLVAEDDSYSQSAYSMLCTGLTVCAGYSMAFEMLCNAAGVDCVTVTSSNHQWNKVRVNDSWYNVDCTWADQSAYIYYEYFERNDDRYDTDSADRVESHTEQDFWEAYLPICSLDSNADRYNSGMLPEITQATEAPNIAIEGNGPAYQITMTSATEGADIYYTLNGEEPASAFSRSKKYRGVFETEEVGSIKAMAVHDGCWDSEVMDSRITLLRFEGNGSTEGQMQNMRYEPGEPLMLQGNTFARAGYRFKGWNTQADGKGIFFADGETIATDGWNGNKTLYAQWEKEIYSITYHLNGGTNSSANPLSYDISTAAIALKNPTRTGYSFAGWYSDAAYQNKVAGIPTGNIGNRTFYARWTKTKYTITYNLNGGTNSSANPSSYDIGTAEIVLKNPTRTGYTFAGWYGDAAYQNKVAKIPTGSTGNKTVYAKWTANKYVITYKGNGSTSGSMSSTSCNYGSSSTLKANAFKKTGYAFGGWNTKADGSGTAYADKATIKNLSSKAGAAVNLYAQWKKTKYTLAYSLNGGKNNSGNPVGYYITSATITLKNPTRTGYTFAGWYKETSYKTKITEIKAGSTGNRTLYARWTPNQYKIAYKGNGSTGGSMSSTSCSYGNNYILKTNAFKKTGYTFAEWNTKADGAGKAYKNKASVKNLSAKSGATVTLYARWKKTKYTIAYHLNGGKNSTGNPSSYYMTSKAIALKNPTRTGYTFAGWYKEDTYKTKVTRINTGSIGNRTLYAKWTPNPYKIVYKGNGNTSGSMTSTACRYGYDYTLKANAFKKKGYTFVEWNTKADGSGKTYKNKTAVRNLTSKSEATITLYARWKKTKYSITYKLNGGKNSTGNPSYYYMTSSSITLKNPVRTGYTFAGWYKESTYKTKVTRIATGSTGNRTLYAKWKKK